MKFKFALVSSILMSIATQNCMYAMDKQNQQPTGGQDDEFKQRVTQLAKDHSPVVQPIVTQETPSVQPIATQEIIPQQQIELSEIDYMIMHYEIDRCNYCIPSCKTELAILLNGKKVQTLSEEEKLHVELFETIISWCKFIKKMFIDIKSVDQAVQQKAIYAYKQNTINPKIEQQIQRIKQLFLSANIAQKVEINKKLRLINIGLDQDSDDEQSCVSQTYWRLANYKIDRIAYIIQNQTDELNELLHGRDARELSKEEFIYMEYIKKNINENKANLNTCIDSYPNYQPCKPMLADNCLRKQELRINYLALSSDEALEEILRQLSAITIQSQEEGLIRSETAVNALSQNTSSINQKTIAPRQTILSESNIKEILASFNQLNKKHPNDIRENKKIICKQYSISLEVLNNLIDEEDFIIDL